MKKFICICIGAFLFISCKSTFHVCPEEDYIEFVKQTNQEIISRGYTPVACNCDTFLVRDYDWGGYTMAMDKIYTSQYTFANPEGDTMEYSLAVNYGTVDMAHLYIDSAVVEGCRTTKEADNDLCTGENMSRLTSPPTRDVKWQTEGGTLAVLIGVPVMVGISFFVYASLSSSSR